MEERYRKGVQEIIYMYPTLAVIRIHQALILACWIYLVYNLLTNRKRVQLASLCTNVSEPYGEATGLKKWIWEGHKALSQELLVLELFSSHLPIDSTIRKENVGM